MAQGSSGTAMIAAALIIGGAFAGGSYLIATAIDRGAGEVSTLSNSLKTATLAAQAAAKPSAPARPQRPDPQKAYEIEVGRAPFKGPKNAPITIVEWADFQ